MLDRVKQYYDGHSDSEWSRLVQGLSAVEFAATLHLLSRHFPPHGRVIDIGSGPGRYSIELTKRSYDVTLIDLSSVLLDRARLEFQKEGLRPPSMMQGSATDLSKFRTGSFDAALMLGPLIHITTKPERLLALSETKRVLIPGGVSIVQYLNSWGLVRTGLTDFPDWYDDPNRITTMLEPQAFEGTLKGFTDCYWSTPPDAIAEVKDAGLQMVTYAGAESFLAGMPDLLENMRIKDHSRYDNVLVLAAAMAELPQFREATDHLLIVAQKPA
jgi:S-adenosylmethionine-dependent methyltransferase